MNNSHIAIGIDIGGSHISCGAVDLKINKLLDGTCFESEVDNKASADDIFKSWLQAINKTISKVGISQVAGIGFAMPGPFDYAKGIGLFERNEKYLHLYGVNVVAEIRSRLGLPDSFPVRFINDATAFAVSEAWIGVGKPYSKLIALTLGTGFGSAFISEGIPVIKGDTVPQYGCVWHLPFGDGIADDYFSTRWFEKSYLKLSGRKVKGVKEISDLFDSDEIARKLLIEYGSNMGDFLAPWIKKFGAQHIVIGGNITGAYNKFGKYLELSLKNQKVDCGVSLSVLKENAAIIGSARLIDAEFFAKVEALLPKM
ncbi:MAG TPA: ROK family protein [Bacteroidales bacterium]|nr:ROK family protein [Bacteroidales bacterium]